MRITLFPVVGIFFASVAAGSTSAATDAEVREALFQEFCVTPGSVVASEAAIRASGRFGPRRLTETGSRNYISYSFLGWERTVVSLVDPADRGIQCSVGVKNVGTNLYEGGRIQRE